MDGENNGKAPIEIRMIWKKTHYFRKHPYREMSLNITLFWVYPKMNPIMAGLYDAKVWKPKNYGESNYLFLWLRLR